MSKNSYSVNFIRFYLLILVSFSGALIAFEPIQPASPKIQSIGAAYTSTRGAYQSGLYVIGSQKPSPVNDKTIYTIGDEIKQTGYSYFWSSYWLYPNKLVFSSIDEIQLSNPKYIYVSSIDFEALTGYSEYYEFTEFNTNDWIFAVRIEE